MESTTTSPILRKAVSRLGPARPLIGYLFH